MWTLSGKTLRTAGAELSLEGSATARASGPEQSSTPGSNACPASQLCSKVTAHKGLQERKLREEAFHLSHLSLSQQTEKRLARGKHSLSGG